MSDLPKDEPKITMFFIEVLETLVSKSLLITASGMLASSLLSSSPLKGVTYLVVITMAILARIGILMLTSYSGPENKSEKCNGGLPGPLAFYDGGRNNIYALSFTMWYIALPMFLEKNMNWYMLFALTVQLALACFITFEKGCVTNYISLALEILGGSLYGCAISVIMYYAGLRSWLMLSGIPTEEQAKNKIQSMRCSIRPKSNIRV
jgi:hypothetical protein